jgi:branched-chain amino acid transport system substrate-binding protein
MRRGRLVYRTAIVCVAVSLLMLKTAQAEIIVGQSCALTGPTSFLGTEMNRGANAFFRNFGNDISIRVLDDAYEPAKCIKNTNLFIAQKVAALFGYVGTPTSKVAVPLSNANNMIFFGAFTGAGFLSDPVINPYAFCVRASYDAEIENMVFHLKNDLNISSIGLFVQRDAFGLAGVRGALRAVKKVGQIEIIPPVPRIPEEAAPKTEWDAFWKHIPNYKRNTIAVGRDARKLSGNRVQAVILIGAYRPCAAAINLWNKLGFDAVFLNISFVGSVGLAERCKSVKNVYISQVVPNPWNAEISVVKEYQQAMGDSHYGFVSLEGYLAAKTFHHAVQNVGPALTSTGLKVSLESMSSYDVGGLTISFGPTDHRGLDDVYLTKVEATEQGNKFVYVDKITKE